MKRNLRSIALVLLAALAGVSCTPRPPARVEPSPQTVGSALLLAELPATASAAAAHLARCEATHAALLAPVSDQGTSGRLALARSGARTLAVIADADDRAVRLFDVETHAEVARVDVDGTPTSVLVARDGRLLVTVVDPPRLVALEPSDDTLASFEPRCDVNVGREPVAMALSLDERALAVVSRWDRSLTLLEGATLRSTRRVALERDPVAVIGLAGGVGASESVGGGVEGRWVVAHSAGSHATLIEQGGAIVTANTLSVQDDRAMAVRPAGPGRDSHASIIHRDLQVESFALVRTEKALLAPGVSIDAGNGIRSGGDSYGDDVPVMGTVTALDPRTGARTQQQRRIAFGKRDCLLPRAAALDGKRLYVACQGIDVVMTLDATRPDPRVAEDEPSRRRVGAGPVGLAVDAPRRQLLVFAELDRELSLEPLTHAPGKKPAARVVIALPPPRRPEAPEVALGRRVFHGEAGRRLSDDGRACASCHASGRDDGLTWTTPDGPRQTPMLVDRLEGAAPFGWNGAVATLDAHLRQTVGRLSGSGLDDAERAALTSYLRSLRAPAPSAATLDAPGDRARQRARGAEIFASEEASCASCHPQGHTDGLAHAAGLPARGDRVKDIDTPSLRHLGVSAPYFHDGRYATLEDLLVHTDGVMGHTGQLSSEDRAALEEYLRGL